MAPHVHIPAPRNTIETYTARPEEELPRNENGEIVCTHEECCHKIVIFRRPCEWKKHMDNKHNRAYKCSDAACGDIPGFTYSGGLLRHMREVHNRGVGSARNPFYCPYPECIRSTGEGFTRRENLQEHLRRKHPKIDRHPPPILSDYDQFLRDRYSPGDLSPSSLPYRLGDLDEVATEFERYLSNTTFSTVQKDYQDPSSGRSVLPIKVGSEIHEALPDTKCFVNVITERKAQALNLHIDRGENKRRTFSNAIGKQFRSVGETVVELSYPDEPNRVYRQPFAVLTECAAPLVIGDYFLRATKVFTHFRHRLRRLASTASRSWRLMYMDTIPRRRFGCIVDAEPAFADIDTGSEKNIASLEYAQYRGWDVGTLPPDEGYVELADGSIEKVCGFVDTSLSIRGQTALKRFYILDGLQCDLILGDEMVDEIDLYNKHESSFVDVQDIDESAEFCAIKWLQIDNRVETLLEDPAFAIPSAPEQQFMTTITKDKVLGRFKRKMKSHSETDYVFNLLLHGLSTARERLENAEVDARRRCRQQMQSLTGTELDKLKNADDQRQKEYQKKREAIHDQKQNLMQWTV